MARPKRTSASEFMRRLEFNPLQVLVRQANKMAKEEPHSKELRELCLDMLPYAYPKLKQIDADIAIQGDVKVVIGGQVEPPNEVVEGEVVELKAVPDE